jgi:hypothetical protein
MTFNGDTSTNYSWHLMYNSGSTVASEAGTSQNYLRCGIGVGANGTANNFGAMVVDVLDAFQTTKFTTTRSLTGNSSSYVGIQLQSGNWRNTAAVATINIKPAFGGDLAANSRFSIYGIKG